MKTETMNKIARAFGKATLTLKKHSPEILVVAGIVGTVTSAVMACKATTKAGDIVEKMKKDLDDIHKASELEDVDYTEEDIKKDTTIVYAQTGIKFAKLYGPSVILGTASIVSILAGHNITRKRNAALTAAYAGVNKCFNEYRDRVVERFGEDLDRELRYNIKAKEFEEKIVDENTGEEKTVTNTVEVASPTAGFGPYTKCFDETCLEWRRDAEYNLMYLRQQENYANERLKRQGSLVLNDIFESLGIPKTKEGNIIGWVYDEKNPERNGVKLHNHIDFGIFDINKEANRNFVNGYERSIWLDFNADGNVMDLL